MSRRKTPRTSRRGWRALAVILGGAALGAAVVWPGMTVAEGFGSAQDYARLSGVARIGGCEPALFGPSYTCRAHVVWDKGWEEDVEVASTTDLEGEVRVQRRTDTGRGASEKYGRVYTESYPRRSGLVTVGVFAVGVVVMLGFWRWSGRRWLGAEPFRRGGDARPAPGGPRPGARPVFKRRK
ncbi:hypothetical protein Afil01_10880 [Actinorhabdospora filicis]|uniref:Uncharacterized protein n=1 Tax=Actinorhabdospora filicis TaxID=1785913 RepID=A0A9W6W8A6_9ACTN|nr:hypothetical protein [Actinorhabdospora filicis]GLZ76281.1 hypothetical protein Afil01_10880 [Actinorhabdospora filicis]